jgi:hypothetical protein
VPLLAAFYVPLDSLVRDFNDAMFNTRQVIDLFIEVCNQPGTANPVGQATVQGALGIVNTAEQQYASLLQRLEELIPDDEVGPDECLLRYNAKAEVLPRINLGTIYVDSFSRRTYARGYCFDGVENQVVVVQALPIPDADLEIFVSVSALDDPAKFLLVARGAEGLRQTVGPLILPRTTTYLLILADLGSETRTPQGDFAFLVSDLTFGTAAPQLEFNTSTNSVSLTVNTTPQPSTGVQCPSLAFTCEQLTAEQVAACYVAGNTILDNDNDGIACEGTHNVNVVGLVPNTNPNVNTSPTVCPSLSFTCNDFFTCGEAQACYNAGNFNLDTGDGNDGNGLPCENTVCFGQSQ